LRYSKIWAIAPVAPPKVNANSMGPGNPCTANKNRQSLQVWAGVAASLRSSDRPHSRQVSAADSYIRTCKTAAPSKKPTANPRWAAARANVTSSQKDCRARVYPSKAAKTARRTKKH